MPLDVAELKAIEALVVRARLFIQDALVIAVDASDPGAVRTIKALLIRLSDTEATFDGRIKGQGQP